MLDINRELTQQTKIKIAKSIDSSTGRLNTAASASKMPAQRGKMHP
jgi:hypothetical protein